MRIQKQSKVWKEWKEWEGRTLIMFWLLLTNDVDILDWTTPQQLCIIKGNERIDIG